jgi:CO/xanthine dehydrogenase Mo-binding subunit
METIFEQTAKALGVDADEFRIKHMRKEGENHLNCVVQGPILQQHVLDHVLARFR